MIYISCFLTSTAFAWLASRSKEKWLTFVWSALSIMVLCVLGGLRYPFMTVDVSLYVQPTFDAAKNSFTLAQFIEHTSSSEVGFFFVTYMSCKNFGSINWALFFYQIITISCFYIGAYRHRKNVSLPLLIFAFCCLQYNMTYMIIRQSMASGIIFMGLTNLEEKKYLRFSLYILAATLFHNSALICFPLLIGVHMVMTSETVLKNNWLNFFIILSTVLVLIYVKPLMLFIVNNYMINLSVAGKYASYILLYGQVKSTFGWFRILPFITLLLALTLYKDKAKSIIMPANRGWANFFQFYLLVHIIYYAFVKFMEQRIFMYQEYMYLLLFATIPKLVKEKYLRLIALTGIIFCLLVYWLYYCVFVGWMTVTWPYRSIL